MNRSRSTGTFENLPLCSSHRDAEDDFVCLRYGVWYPSIDCAFRTKFRTSAGCLDCDQGRFNLKRHNGAIARLRGSVRAESSS